MLVSEVELLTVTEAASILHVSPKQVRRLIDKGEFPIVPLGTSGKGDRIDRADLVRYIHQIKRVKGVACQSIAAKVVPIGGYMSKSGISPSGDLRKLKTSAKRKK